MSKSIKVKSAFTLMELIIVVLLIGSTYFLVFSNFSSKKEKEYQINIENIKEFLLKNFKYKDNLSLQCFKNDSNDCYVFIDNNINKDITIKELFNKIPLVYNYDRDLSDYVFSRIKIDDIEYEPFFELTFNSDRKHKNLVLDTQDSYVYLIKSIKKEVKRYESTNEIIDQFSLNKLEVKDAL